jgi:hypothetical protein
MRKVLLSTVLMLSVAAAGSALAAEKAKPMATKTAAAAPADKAKTADCEKQWKAEKKHSQTRKAFMASCTAKA